MRLICLVLFATTVFAVPWTEKQDWNHIESVINECFGHLDEHDLQNILLDVKNRLASPEFITNPHDCMQKWTQERGQTEEFQIPQDPSMDIIHSMFFLGKLRPEGCIPLNLNSVGHVNQIEAPQA